jgi:hypothetical protein
MDPQPRKLRHQARQESEHEQQAASEQRHATREFNSVEEMLRHDAEQVAVPPHIAARVQESIALEPKPQKGWWGRLFGR